MEEGSPTRWRGRLGLVAALLTCTAVALAMLLLPQRIERSVSELAVREAARRGVALRIGRVRFSWTGPLRFERVAFQDGQFAGRAGLVSMAWRPSRRLAGWPRALRLAGLSLRAGETEIAVSDSTWDLVALARDRLEIRQRSGTSSSLTVSWSAGSGAEARLADYDLDTLLAVTRGGAPVGKIGRVSGRLSIGGADTGGFSFDLLAVARGVRVASVVDDETGERRELGAPTDVELAAGGSIVPAWQRVQLACFRLESSGVSMTGSGALEEGADDVWADVGIDVPRFELAPVVAASGMRLDLEGTPLPPDLGSATLTAELSGHLRDPDTILVDQKLVFHRPAGGVPALAYLNGPFTHVVELDERDVSIDVRAGAPGYVALEDVPRLFLRALTISEDAAFWSHPGVDLSEIPVALATNWRRGERARGGSTITQQLVKNLFLSKRKSYGRKLQEAALALLVESAVPKRRILEIYLNVIEWGPGIYGLRPAARHYFGKEPRDLTPKETAFLVSIIPGPIKYQRSFAGGTLSPRFAPLVTGVLAKLRSVDAISEEEYEKALAEPLDFAFTKPEGPPFAAGE
jgi:hypothetical protein